MSPRVDPRVNRYDSNLTFFFYTDWTDRIKITRESKILKKHDSWAAHGFVSKIDSLVTYVFALEMLVFFSIKRLDYYIGMD